MTKCYLLVIHVLYPGAFRGGETQRAICPDPQTYGGGGEQKHDRNKKRVPLRWGGATENFALGPQNCLGDPDCTL